MRGAGAEQPVVVSCNGAGAKGLRCSALAIGQLETGGAGGRGKAVQDPKREVWEAFKSVKANQGAAGVMDRRLRSSRRTFRATSTSSGIGCRQGATFLRRCGGSRFQKQVAERGRRANPTLIAHWALCHGNGRTSGAV